jgi:endonuclease/exonuclease/phosphatase family metal-dependent hydrolase
MMLVSCGPIRNYDDPNEPFYEGHYAGNVPNLGETIKIVTWNLSFAENLDSALDALTSVEELMGADIILLQEMDELGVELLAKDLGYNYVYYPASIHPRHKKKFGNAVLTRWEITDHEKIILPKIGAGNKHTRNAVKAVIMIADQEVTAYSAHFETFWILQSKNQTQVEFLANQIDHQERVIIIGGDFNSLTKGSVAYLEERFRKNGVERLSKNTGHTFEYSGVKLTLDHIFSSGVEDFEADVWRETDASDHYPVWSKIKIQGIQ